jgi:hypothetical protein
MNIMLFKKIESYKIILLTLVTLTLAMGILIFITPPSLFPDPSWGFLVLRSMQMGGRFNLLVGPDHDNISKNAATFLSWWSPGQYLIPYFFKLLFNINTGKASALTITLSNLSGVAGFYCFFKKLGFTKIIAAISMIFIVCQQVYWLPYDFYNGGEVLLFSFTGWFLYGCVALSKPGFKLLLFVLLSGIAGFVCKSSFMWVYVSGLLCLWIRLSSAKTNLFGWIKKGVWLALPTIAAMATIYLFYLSKGGNPASDSEGFKLTTEAIAFPIASPVLTGFSVDDMVNGLISHSDKPIFTYNQSIIILWLSALLSLILIWAITRYVPNKTYRLFMLTFYSVSILFFGYSFLRQAAISYESRHFRIIGLLMVPGMIYLVSRIKIGWQLAFLLITIIIARKTISFTWAMHNGNMKYVHGISGFTIGYIDHPSLDHIRMLDKQNNNAIFVFVSGDIGLEIQHHRIIVLNEYDENTEKNIDPYNGHAGPIYMMLPATYTGKQVAVMCKYFPGYKNFTPTRLSKDYVLYTAQ